MNAPPHNRPPRKPRLALWFRYGPAEHAELFHALPAIVERLATRFDVVYVGFASREKPAVPDAIRRHARVVQIPIRISRRRNADKAVKTLLWIALVPWIALACRLARIRHVYVDETLPLVLPIGRLFFGDRITMTIADLFIEQYLSKGPLRRALGAFLFRIDLRAWRRAPLLFARSAGAKTHLARLGIPPERVRHAYDAVDASLYRPRDRQACRQQWNWAPDVFILAYHGVLNPAKDLDTILDALPAVVREFPLFRFLVVGNGPDESRLRAKTETLGLAAHVQFAGYREPADVAVALGGADAGLVCRKADLGSQMVVTSVLGHCFACALPVLATRAGGIPELLEDGQNGLLYEPGDSADCARQLLRLCRYPALRARLAQAGLETARRKLSLEETVHRNAQPLLDLWAPAGDSP